MNTEHGEIPFYGLQASLNGAARERLCRHPSISNTHPRCIGVDEPPDIYVARRFCASLSALVAECLSTSAMIGTSKLPVSSFQSHLRSGSQTLQSS